MSSFKNILLLIGVLLCVTLSASRLPNTQHVKDQIRNTELLADNDEETLLISTLDGALHAITKSSGARKWMLRDDPVIINPTDSSQPPLPQFFPNPQDGSLYRYTLGRSRDPLKKLPFTIPQLVANSPCRSSDGIFYVGKKIDSWVGVDSITGEKQLELGVDNINRKCPKPSRNTVYFGRTLYNIILYEAASGNKWNISFSEYATSTSSSVENYDLVHYTSTGEGSILTVDQQTGSLLWTLELESPLVAMYQLGPDGGLLNVPITTVAPQTLNHFTEEFMHLTHHSSGGSEGLLIKKLSPTIYIGECSSGVYAIPALVDANTATISRRGSQLLLEGPPGTRGTMGTRPVYTTSDAEEEKTPEVLLLGYYEIPENVKSDLIKTSPEEINKFRDRVLPLGITHEKNESSPSRSRDSDKAVDKTVWNGVNQVKQMNVSFILSREIVIWFEAILESTWLWLVSDTLNLLLVIIIIGMGGIAVLLYRQARDYARLTREMSSRRPWSTGSNNSGNPGSITAVAEELENGNISVGKIVFDPQQLLGKGCDGTFVFKGTFDGRSVAVKRVLPGCFSIADREVDLLRESDQHPNVIRYFCTEQCRQFRYIALELCTATLEDFIQGRFSANISCHTILLEATSGLQHLHSLDIVHRDIKPHNVLLSLPNSKGEVRAMISDFGLCKRLETGRMSFSKRSGITGTEGWIAPEIMLNTSRPTSKVDVFSLGCVFYYVLTGGKHPFGSVLDRQSNIISGKLQLDDLQGEKDVTARTLVEAMVSGKPAERPPVTVILKHPIFWNPERTLGFFQDVSDRVEKEGGDSVVVMNLERGGVDVVQGDWRQRMHPVIAEDLRRFRDYKGRSVRDLLRALRNKRNHYRELKEEARMVFGRIPDEFVAYWTDRFPRLLLHTWYALQCVRSEPIFKKYYDAHFSFAQDGVSILEEDQQSVQSDYAHDTQSFAPSNHNWTSGGGRNTWWSQSSHNPQQNWSLLDSLLNRNSTREENGQRNQEEKNPKWIIRKTYNTFEPKYAVREGVGIDGPWRKPPNAPETSTRVPAEGEVVESDDSRLVLGNNGPSEIRPKIRPTRIEEVQEEVINDEDRESQEVGPCSEKEDDIAGASSNTLTESTVSSVPECVAHDSDQQTEPIEMRKDASQLRFRPVWTNKKEPQEEAKRIQVVTGSGKKKKKKNIVVGGNIN